MIIWMMGMMVTMLVRMRMKMMKGRRAKIKMISIPDVSFGFLLNSNLVSYATQS